LQDIEGLEGYYDALDASSLFTDTARTTPVTAHGNSVKGWKDLTGLGHHLSEATVPPTFAGYVLAVGHDVNNGNFETLGAGGGDTFASWVETVANASTVTAVAGFTGTYAAKLIRDLAGDACRIDILSGLVVGDLYRIRLTARLTNAGTVFYVGDSSGSATITPGHNNWAEYTIYRVATATTFRINTQGSAGTTLEIDDVLVERIQGVEFDGTQYIRSAGFTLAQPLTRVSVMAQMSWAVGDAMLSAVGAECRLYQRTATPRLTMNAGANGPTTTNLAVETLAQVTEVYNGASSELFVNGTSQGTGNVGSNAPGGVGLGANDDGSGTGNVLVCAHAVFNRVLTSKERVFAEQQLAKRWRL